MVKLETATQQRFGRGVHSLRSVSVCGQLGCRPSVRLLFPAPVEMVDGPPEKERTVLGRLRSFAELDFDVFEAGLVVDPDGQPL